jgi:hypothetical protein
MSHSRASTQHMCPQVGDVLVTNLRAPLLTVVEDTSPGAHDTLMAACDPPRYKELGVEKWEEHGSCAENLVLSLQQLNRQVGLKGRKAIGCDVTVNNVPAPLNLFMNIPWDDQGQISFSAPKGKRGDYIRFRAERDVIIVMSACPQDITDINGKKPMVAHFMVESPTEKDKRTADDRDQEAQKIIKKAKTRSQAEQKQRQTQASTQSRSTSQPTLSTSASNQGASRRPAPRKLNSSGSTGKSSTSTATPYKETQRVELSPASPRPGRKQPRKLERRGTSEATTPRA